MALLLGTRRGLEATSSARGTFTVLALDHRQNLRKELHPEAPESTTLEEMVAFKRTVVRALAAEATGTLLDPEVGAAQCIADGSLSGHDGLLVALEATGYDGPANARVSRLLPGWDAAKAKRLGASAAKLLIYYHPDAAERGGPGTARRGRGCGLSPGGPRALRRAPLVRARWRARDG